MVDLGKCTLEKEKKKGLGYHKNGAQKTTTGKLRSQLQISHMNGVNLIL